MGESALASSMAAVAVAVITWLLVHVVFRQISSTAVAVAFVLLMVLAGAVGVFFVDTNMPLSLSHYRPGGEPAPVWVALLAWGTKVAALLGVTYFGRWARSRRDHG